MVKVIQVQAVCAVTPRRGDLVDQRTELFALKDDSSIWYKPDVHDEWRQIESPPD